MADQSQSRLRADGNGHGRHSRRGRPLTEVRNARDELGGSYREFIRPGFEFNFIDERRTALVIATGPTAIESLDVAEDEWQDGWERYPTIAVNNAWRIAPRAQLCYAADEKWWRHVDRLSGSTHHSILSTHFAGVGCTSSPSRFNDLIQFRIDYAAALSAELGSLAAGGPMGNSGAQAINLAWQLGANRLLLIGFDMHASKDGRQHYFGNHPPGLHITMPFERFIKGMGPLAAELHRAGADVVNCSPGSALPYWPRSTLAAEIMSPP